MASSTQTALLADVCCPEFDPAPWQDKIVTWDNKKFIQASVPQFLHIPLPGTIEKAMTKLSKQAAEAKAELPTSDWVCVSNDPSPWKSIFYMAVSTEVPEADNVTLSGTFLTRVYDGNYNEVPKWIKDFEENAKSQGQTVKDYYFYYTTCPKCAKKYGHNYTVVFGKIK